MDFRSPEMRVASIFWPVESRAARSRARHAVEATKPVAS
jgi:hypothetical protein